MKCASTTRKKEDSYQHIEPKYELTRRALQVIAGHHLPVHMLTKSTHIERDIDILKKINEETKAIVSFSFSSVDDDISRVVEPGVPSPSRRLKTIERFKNEGIACGMFLLPVIPFITDTAQLIEGSVTRAKDAGADFVIFGCMTLEQGRQRDYFMNVVNRMYPEIESQYGTLYTGSKRGEPDAEPCRTKVRPAEWRLPAQCAPLKGGPGIEMSMLLMAPDLNPRSWIKHLRLQDPELDLRVWPEVGRAEEVVFVLSWGHPPGELKRFPKLRWISSLGFGVDHVLRAPDLPAGVPVTRLVDPGMIAAMSEYILTAVLAYTRQFDLYRQDQTQKRWEVRLPKIDQHVRVGIMGLGHLGSDAARKLQSLGFAVSGWSRLPKAIDGISNFAGADGLDKFLAQSDILICLLPLTPATEGILNRRTFAKLPAGAYVINAARGEHLVEEDLLEALAGGHIAGACLDVFRQEPLPAYHPFWSHPRVTVTPHIASLTYPTS